MQCLRIFIRFISHGFSHSGTSVVSVSVFSINLHLIPVGFGPVLPERLVVVRRAKVLLPNLPKPPEKLSPVAKGDFQGQISVSWGVFLRALTANTLLF